MVLHGELRKKESVGAIASEIVRGATKVLHKECHRGLQDQRPRPPYTVMLRRRRALKACHSMTESERLSPRNSKFLLASEIHTQCSLISAVKPLPWLDGSGGVRPIRSRFGASELRKHPPTAIGFEVFVVTVQRF